MDERLSNKVIINKGKSMHFLRDKYYEVDFNRKKWEFLQGHS